MKGWLIKLVALFSSLLLMFSLVACSGDREAETTTAKGEDVVATEIVTDKEGETVTDEAGENVTVAVEVEDNSETTSEKKSEKKTENKTTKKADSKTTTKKSDTKTTTKKSETKTTAATTKKEDVAPVNGSIAEIVSFYNNAANASKAKQNFSTEKREVTKITIDSISNIKPEAMNNSVVQKAVRGLGNTLLNVLSGDGKWTQEKFVNGEPTNDKKVTKNIYFPIMESSKMSTLTADGVKSATCKKDGDGYIVTIVLKPEKGSLTQIPKHHAACVNYLRLEVLDINPFFVSEATMNYTDSSNSGTKFVARINKDNLLDYFNTYMTLEGSGNGGVPVLGSEISASAALHGTYTAEIKFKW